MRDGWWNGKPQKMNFSLGLKACEQERGTNTRETFASKRGGPIHARRLRAREGDQYTRDACEQERGTNTRETLANNMRSLGQSAWLPKWEIKNWAVFSRGQGKHMYMLPIVSWTPSNWYGLRQSTIQRHTANVAPKASET